MAEKQTICPHCASIYKVSVTQLTVAQGMVCCPKCQHNFNALVHLQKNATAISNLDLNHSNSISDEANTDFSTKLVNENSIFDIFKRKVEHSNIDLKTYLNNLNYFNNEPINNIPSLNLSQGIQDQHRNTPTRSKFYYLFWTFINFALLSILLFQIVWFNPKLTDRYPLINSIFTHTCAVLHCETIDQRYKQVLISHVQVDPIDSDQTQFSGQINNHYFKSLELPNIELTLKVDHVVVNRYILTSHEYLIESLQGIKRIPQNSPYPFKFIIKQPRNSFEQYELTIIHP